jgi:hypothetical protein
MITHKVSRPVRSLFAAEVFETVGSYIIYMACAKNKLEGS